MFKKILKSRVFGFVSIFCCIFVAFYMYTYGNFKDPYFIDNDSFFHVAIAKLMMKQGLVIDQFPYLHFTVWTEKFADWHFIYHVLLIPFIKLFGDATGPKILGGCLMAGLFGVIYLILREKGLRYANLYTLALFFLMPAAFYYRMSTIRGAILALLLMTLAVYWIIKNRPVALAVTAFVFVWSYYLASYFIFVPIIGLLICQILRKEKISYQLLIYGLVGFIAGVIINPYFPKNIQLFPIFLKAGFRNDVWYEGKEIFPISTWDWFYGSIMVTILFLGSFFISIIKNIKHSSSSIAVSIFASFLLVLQWRSQRFVEYWPIYGGLTGLVLAGPFLEEVFVNIKNNWKKFRTWLIIVIVAVYIQEGLFHGIWEKWQLNKIFQGESQLTNTLKEISIDIKNNSEKGDIIFARWDIFPQLFYFNDKNYYVDGNGLVWIEVHDQDLFNKYLDLTFNQNSKTDVISIKSDFNAKWVIAEKPLKEMLDKKPEVFEKIYEKNQFTVFKVK